MGIVSIPNTIIKVQLYLSPKQTNQDRGSPEKIPGKASILNLDGIDVAQSESTWVYP